MHGGTMAACLTTPRLQLRELQDSDAAFILRLLNEPSFIDNIADRGVRSIEQAAAYIESGPRTSYRAHGFGLWAVVIPSTQQCIGLCGLLQRDNLPGADIGYALLPEFCGQGYAEEAARACLQAAQETFHRDAVFAVVNPGNSRSRRLLTVLGFSHQRDILMSADQDPVCLYHTTLRTE